MRSSSREEIVEVFDALQAAMKRALDLTFDALTTPERLALLQQCETFRRWLPAVEHPLINQLGEQADAASWAANWPRPWPTGCGSAAPTPHGASMKPPIWVSGGL